MGQLVPKMKAWELHADQRDRNPATEQTEAPALAGQSAVEDGRGDEHELDADEDQTMADAGNEDAMLNPHVGY